MLCRVGTQQFLKSVTQNGYPAQFSVGVSTSIISLSVSPTSKTLNIGETVQLTGTKNPTSASEGTQWTSSNTGVATVSGSGLVTAKAAGTATITFKNSSSTKSANCKIEVVSSSFFVSGIAQEASAQQKLRKHDTNGNIVWEKVVTDKTMLSNNRDVTVNHLVALQNGGCIINILAKEASAQQKLRKYDTNGNIVWEKVVTDKTMLSNSREFVIDHLAVLNK